MAKRKIWSGWDGVGTAAVTLVGPIAYFTRIMKVNRMQPAGQSLYPSAEPLLNINSHDAFVVDLKNHFFTATQNHADNQRPTTTALRLGYTENDEEGAFRLLTRTIESRFESPL